MLTASFLGARWLLHKNPFVELCYLHADVGMVEDFFFGSTVKKVVSYRSHKLFEVHVTHNRTFIEF